jgi:hypothetical protein
VHEHTSLAMMAGHAAADPLTPTLSPDAGGEGVTRVTMFGKATGGPITPALSPVAGGEGVRALFDAASEGVTTTPSPACGRGLG